MDTACLYTERCGRTALEYAGKHFRAVAPELAARGGVMAKRLSSIEFGDMWRAGETASENHEKWATIGWRGRTGSTFWNMPRMIGEQAAHKENRNGIVVMPAVLAVRAT